MTSFKPTRIFEPKPQLAKQPARKRDPRPPSPPPAKAKEQSPSAPAAQPEPKSDPFPSVEPAQPLVARTPLAPAGSSYTLAIERVAVFDKPRLGPGLKVDFAVALGEHSGCVAHGLFPFAKSGLVVLVAAALGEQAESWDAQVGDRLVGAKILADIVRSGGGERGEAVVRNIRPCK